MRADRGGVVDAVIPISLEPGWHVATIETPGGVAVEAPTQIIGPDVSFGIVSDVDDTVMVTVLPRPFVAAWNTFVLDEHARIPTPGMAVLMERLVSAHPGSPVVYLSTGAWNVAPTLTRFLSRNIYPAGTLLLTDWGPTHDRWFRSGQEHKRDNLRRLAEEFPNIKWLLIGDDGQHDEDVYREFSAERPGHVVGRRHPAALHGRGRAGRWTVEVRVGQHPRRSLGLRARRLRHRGAVGPARNDLTRDRPSRQRCRYASTASTRRWSVPESSRPSFWKIAVTFFSTAPDADEEPLGDAGVRAPLGHQLEHLALPRRQRRRAGRRVAPISSRTTCGSSTVPPCARPGRPHPSVRRARRRGP